jgi:hypothetical protein
MPIPNNTKIKIVRFIRLLARLDSLLLVLFWGAFFVEHLRWFIQPEAKPPLRIWLIQGAHLGLLLSYLISLKWERTGSLLIIAASLLFFIPVAGPQMAYFILISVGPAGLYLFSQWMARKWGVSGH